MAEREALCCKGRGGGNKSLAGAVKKFGILLEERSAALCESYTTGHARSVACGPHVLFHPLLCVVCVGGGGEEGSRWSLQFVRKHAACVCVYVVYTSARHSVVVSNKVGSQSGPYHQPISKGASPPFLESRSPSLAIPPEHG